MSIKLGTKGIIFISSAAAGAMLFTQVCLAGSASVALGTAGIDLNNNVPNRGVCVPSDGLPNNWACVETKGLFNQQNELLVNAYTTGKTCQITWSDTDASGYAIIGDLYCH